jgi:hypothetical protein
MALILRDFFNFAPSAGRAGGPSSDPEVRETASRGKGLKVTFSASHAGMVNGNNVMYAPSGMEKSVHTWVWPQRQPIQVHHDDHADPIGRVINARYSGYGSSDLSIHQKDAIDKFNGLVSRDEIVEAAKILEDAEVLDRMDWKGVGELVLDGVISDSSAVEKVLDGRYSGVSITQRPKQAFCSLCGHDWAKEGKPCEHRRGEVDEDTGRRMYLIVGDTDYVEVSYVNSPADRHAMTTSASTVDRKDIISSGIQKDDKNGNDLCIMDSNVESVLSFELVDSLGEGIEMSRKKNRKNRIRAKQAQEEVIAEDSEQENAKELDPVESEDILEEDSVELEVELESISDKAAPSDEDEEEQVLSDAVLEEDKEEESEEEPKEETEVKTSTIEEALKCLFEQPDNFSSEMAELVNEEMEKILDENSDPESDAKLSTKKRNSLPDSAFCGPNRSFPVPDCAHVTAARRLIGSYKGTGSKKSILACVDGKARTLGCDKAKEEDSFVADEQPSVLEKMSDSELQNMFFEAEKHLIRRGVKAERKCESCDELARKISDFEEIVPDLEETTRVLRSEYRTLLGECSVSIDSHQETLTILEDTLKSVALNYLLLVDKDASEEELRQEVAEMSFEDMKEVVADTDISEVISFVRSGLSKEPEEKVSITDAEPEEVVQVVAEEKLSESLVNLYRKHGLNYANICMNDWIRAGKLPEDFTLDKALELVAK